MNKYVWTTALLALSACAPSAAPSDGDQANAMAPLEGLPADSVTHPARYEISQLIDAGIIGGFPDGTFRPDDTLTRAQYAAMLAQFVLTYGTDDTSDCMTDEGDRCTFSDVGADDPATEAREGHWAHDAVRLAAARRFIAGFPDGTFRPEEPLTRQQLLVSLAYGLGVPFSESQTEEVLARFEDGAEVEGWARYGVAAAIEVGAFSNVRLQRLNDFAIRPNDFATRAELASYVLWISRVYDRTYVGPKQLEEVRAGWLHLNPSFSYLADPDMDWVFRVQSGHHADGLDNMPTSDDFAPGQFVSNGMNGYGCVSVASRFDHESGHLTRVLSGLTLPLEACRNDPALRHLEEPFYL